MSKVSYGEPVMAIAANNSLVHAGPAAAVARHWADLQPDPPPGTTWPAVEFVDAKGIPLTLVPPDDVVDAHFDRDDTLPEPDDDAKQLLVDRIDLALARAQLLRDEQRADPNGDRGFGPARIVRVTGELTSVITALAALDDASSHSQPGRGGWFHNLMHGIFG
jgi:hypothetical protein